MSTHAKSETAAHLTALQVVTLLLSIYVLVALFVQSVFRLPPETTAMLDRIDFVVCIVFLADFFVQLVRAPAKLKFLRWGWIDFVSSIPMLDILGWGGSSGLFGSCACCGHSARPKIS